MTRIYGFSDCRLCYGSGSIENLATGARERCWLCVERGTRNVQPDEEVAPTPVALRPRVIRRFDVSAPPDLQGIAPERAASLLRAGLWVPLDFAGFAFVRFTKPNREDDSRTASDEFDSLDANTSRTKTTNDYSKWEPAP